MKRNRAAQRWLRKRKRAVKGGLAKLVALTGEAKVEDSKLSSATITATHPHNNDAGILRPDDRTFRLPNALADAGELERPGWMPSGFVLFVIVSAIIFIGIVAWQVSQMPEAK